MLANHFNQDSDQICDHHGEVVPSLAVTCAQAAIAEVSDWADQLSDYGWPHFGEFAQRCQALRGLVKDALMQANATHDVKSDVSAAEHQLLQQLDALIDQLNGVGTCFASWQQACRAYRQICDQFRLLISSD